MSTIEDLRKDKAANDDKIKELESKIKKYDDMIERGEDLKPAQEKQLADWRARVTELTNQNTQYAQQLTELSKPSPSSTASG